MQTIPYDYEFSQVSNGHTESPEPFTGKRLRILNLDGDAIPCNGLEEEFDIDDHIDGHDIDTRQSISEAGKWVADQFYAGHQTLTTLRLRAGLSQAELGALCGMQQPHISRYESGRHEPGVFQAAALAKALGVSLDTLVEALRQHPLPEAE
jgi:DNA-binding XRE family transcriptional regulator